MQAKDILKSSVLDIVFDNRNKAYGAYELRKFYNNRIRKALFLTFSFMALLATLALVKANPNTAAKPKPEGIETVLAEIEKEKPVEPVKKETVATQKVNADAFTNNLKIVKATEKKDTVVTLRENAVVANTTIVTNDTPSVVLVNVLPSVDPPSTGGPFVATKPEPEVDPSIPVANDALEQQPEFPGGKTALRRYLENHLEAPDGLEEGEKKTVMVRFIVGFDGKLQHFELLKDGGRVFNEEVFRVLKKMPQWAPGKSNGRSVAAYHTLPVIFEGLPQ